MTYICEACGNSHNGSYGSGRFWSSNCAHSFSTKNCRNIVNHKVSNTLLKRRFTQQFKTNFTSRYCIDCNKLLCFRNTSGYCSNCYSKHIVVADETKQKISFANKGRSRWNIRRNQISFAEQYWINALNINRIPYIHEYQIPYDKQNHSYYMDFKIGHIDLEIDGAQHDDRKELDDIRDNFMRSAGYFVYRVKWNNIRTASGIDMMREKLWLFLEFYDKIGHLYE